MKNVLSRLLVASLLVFTLSASTIYIGMEDIALPSGDKDYNDAVLRLSGDGLSMVQVHGNGGWQQMVTPNEDGTPFWDNVSWDGAGMNVGYYMTGTGAFAGGGLGIPVSQLEYWGIGTAADPSFLFSSTGSTTAQVLLEVSALKNSQVYWFNAATPTVMNLLVPGSAGPGFTASFSPSGNFGLEVVSSLVRATTNCEGEQFFLGRQTPSGVPEPATCGMLGTGFIVLGAFHRRRQRKR